MYVAYRNLQYIWLVLLYFILTGILIDYIYIEIPYFYGWHITTCISVWSFLPQISSRKQPKSYHEVYHEASMM